MGNFAADEDFGTSAGHKRRTPSSSSSVPAPSTGLDFKDEVSVTNAPLPSAQTALSQSRSEQDRGTPQNGPQAVAAKHKRKHAEVDKAVVFEGSSAVAAAGAGTGFMATAIATADDNEEERWTRAYEAALNALRVEAELGHVPLPVIESFLHQKQTEQHRRQRPLKYVRDPGVRAHTRPRSIEARARSAATLALKRYLKLTMGDAYTGQELTPKKKRSGKEDAEEKRLNRERKRKLRDEKREERKRIRIAAAESRKLAKRAKKEEKERARLATAELRELAKSAKPDEKKRLKALAARPGLGQGQAKKRQRLEMGVDGQGQRLAQRLGPGLGRGPGRPRKKQRGAADGNERWAGSDSDDDDRMITTTSQAAAAAGAAAVAESATSYVDQVKWEFSDQLHIYNEFVDILKNFKARFISTPDVIERVKDLFRGHNQLILGFNVFLPKEHQIELDGKQACSPPNPLSLLLTTTPPPQLTYRPHIIDLSFVADQGL